MLQNRDKPLLLIDIDGVLSLFGQGLDASPTFGAWTQVDGIAHFLSHTVAGHLQGVIEDFEPVWCSGWEDKANEHLPHLLGLGPFPHLTFARDHGRDHWKLAAIDAHAIDRPLAWIDDAHDDACVRWAAEREGRGVATLLVGTDPARGLTATDAEALRAWAAGARG